MTNTEKNHTRHTTYQVVRDLLEGDSFDEGTVAEISTRVNRAESGVRNALMRLRSEGVVTFESGGGRGATTWSAKDEDDGLTPRQRGILEYLRDDNPGGTIGFGAYQVAAAVGISRLDAWNDLMALSQLGLVRTDGDVWYPTLTGDQEKKTPEPEPEPAPSPLDGLTRRQRNILQYLQDGRRGYPGEIAAAVGGMDRLDAWDALMRLDWLGLARTKGDRWYATLTGDQEKVLARIQLDDRPEPEPQPEPKPEPETASKKPKSYSYEGLTRIEWHVLGILWSCGQASVDTITRSLAGASRVNVLDALLNLEVRGLLGSEGDRWYNTDPSWGVQPLPGAGVPGEPEPEPKKQPEPEPEPESKPKPEPILDLANAVKGLRDGDVEAGDIHKLLQRKMVEKMVELAKSAVNGGGSVTYSSNPDGGIELCIHGPERSSTSQVIAALTRAGDWA